MLRPKCGNGNGGNEKHNLIFFHVFSLSKITYQILSLFGNQKQRGKYE